MTGNAVAIRPSTAADADLLFRLFAENKGDELAVLGLPREVLAVLLYSQYEARCHSYAADFPSAEQFILMDGEVEMGQFLVARYGDTLRVIDMGVLRDQRNRGLGTAALVLLLDRAASEGCDVSLSVRVDSPAARLYTRIGFREIGATGTDRAMCWTAPREATHAA